MPRKIKLKLAAPNPTWQERVWAALREIKVDIDSDRLFVLARVPVAKIQVYLRMLSKAGYIEMTDYARRDTPAKYRLLRDTGVDAPRLKRDGAQSDAGRLREALWRTLKIIGEFDVRELAVAASTAQCPVSEQVTRAYVLHLACAGYLVRVRKQNPAARIYARYRFVASRNTGPKPPQPRRGGVYDPNIATLRIGTYLSEVRNG